MGLTALQCPVEARQCGVDPLFRSGDLRLGLALAGPERGDAEERVLQTVEDQHQRRACKQHVRDIESLLVGARQFLHQSDGLIPEVADKARQRRRQAFGHIDPAFLQQRPHGRECAIVALYKSIAIPLPVAIDLGLVALRAEHQVRIEAKQAVTPAHLATLDRFQQEVASSLDDQL